MSIREKLGTRAKRPPFISDRTLRAIMWLMLGAGAVMQIIAVCVIGYVAWRVIP